MNNYYLPWKDEPITEGQKKLIKDIQKKFNAPEFNGTTKGDANVYIRKYNKVEDGSGAWRKSYTSVRRPNGFYGR